MHMYAFVDRTPENEIKWVDRALAVVQASTQPTPSSGKRRCATTAVMRCTSSAATKRRLLNSSVCAGSARTPGQVCGIRIAHWMIAMTLRHMGRLYAALEIQRRLEREWDADGEPDPYVFEELEKIYRARGDTARADPTTLRA